MKKFVVLFLAFFTLSSACPKTQVSDKKTSNSRLAKHEKCEFTVVNDHFECKRNDEVGVFLQRLSNITVPAQETKDLTIKDAVVGQWSYLYPEYIMGLKWRGNTDNVTYYSVPDKGLVQESVKYDKKSVVVSLDDLNKEFTKEKIDSIRYIAAYDWENDNVISFMHGSNYIKFDVNKKKVLTNIELDSKAENTDVKDNKIAYTIENNLYVNNNGKVIQLTNNTEKGIVCGQTVHRNEFGINKGTFWSPDGKLLAYYRKDETMVTDYPIVDITTRTAEAKPIKYPMAGMKSHHVNLVVYNLKTGKRITLKTGEPKEQYLTNVVWSPDSKNIYIAVLNRGQNHMKLNMYDAVTGDFKQMLFEEKNDKYVEPEHPMIFLPNNPKQFIWQSEKDGYNHLYLYNTAGNQVNQLTKGDWVVTSTLGFDKTGNVLYYESTQESPIERHVYALNLKNSKITKITQGAGTHSVRPSKGGKYFVDIHKSIDIPAEYKIVTIKGKTERVMLKSENPLKDYGLAEMTLGTIKAADNKTDLHYRLIKPRDFDANKKYPTIVYVYGGPHAQLVNNTWLGGAALWEYYMAQKGYVIFVLDNRGSANRGFEFESVIHRKLGENEMADQMKGVEFLKSHKYVDAEKIGVHGWSFGGFMTTSLMTHYPDVFKVGVAGGPVIDWRLYEVMYGERYMDTPEENPEGYEQANLLKQAKNLKGKLMLIHGGIDPVVVWQHSLQFVRECVKNGVQLDYFVYPTHEHNVRGADRVHLKDKVSIYFDDYLK